MAILVRPVLPEDVAACGRAAYEAHTTVASAHNLPSEHPSVEFSTGLIKAKVSDPNVYGCVAAQDGHIDDLARCNTLCAGVHGFARDFELSDAVRQNVALVVERSGRLTGYAAGLGLRGHAAAETTEDLKALISSAPRILGPGFFVPVRNGELFRWLLEAGLRAAWPANLMTLGPYQEPAGAYLSAIAF